MFFLGDRQFLCVFLKDFNGFEQTLQEFLLQIIKFQATGLRDQILMVWGQLPWSLGQLPQQQTLESGSKATKLGNQRFAKGFPYRNNHFNTAGPNIEIWLQKIKDLKAKPKNSFDFHS